MSLSRLELIWLISGLKISKMTKKSRFWHKALGVNGLITHRIQTKEIMALAGFGNLILISINFHDFIFSVFSLLLVLIEKKYPTLKTLSHFIFKHLELRQKNTRLRVVFSTFSLVFGNAIKHGLSSLICYLSHSQAQEESNN